MDVNDRKNEKKEDGIHLTEDKSVLTHKSNQNTGLETKVIYIVIK